MIKSRNIIYKNIEMLVEELSRIEVKRPDQGLVQVFSGIVEVDIIQEIIDTVNECLPGMPLIGATTAGEIVNGKPLEKSIIINISTFEETRVKSAIFSDDDDLMAVGKNIAEAVGSSKTKSLILLGSGLKKGHTVNGTDLLKSLQKALPNVPVSGGQAGDNGESTITYVFSEKGITSTGVVAAALDSESLQVVRTYNLSWVPIGKKMTITKATGSKVYEIDNMSPYEVYNHYLGEEVVDGLPFSAIEFPLVIERDGMWQAIHATGVNEDGSFNFIHDFRVGEQIRFGYCHIGLLMQGANEMHDILCENNLEVAFVYSCVSRKWILGDDIDVELTPVKKVACSAGFYSYGEYYQIESGTNLFLGQTMTFLGLKEGDSGDNVNNGDCIFSPKESRQFKTMRVLQRLVEKSTEEIENMNEELAELVHIDTLTGLGNRRMFDQSLQNAVHDSVAKEKPLSIILFDVDYFKKYNDTYGHVEGDNCLRAIGQIVKSIASETSSIATRYGGEEFGLILSDTDYDVAMGISEDLRKGIQQLSIRHSVSDTADVVTASLGVVTCSLNEMIDPNSLVKKCDRMLYEAKAKGRNRSVGCVALQDG